MAAPAVIYRPDRGRVAEEEELVYPTKMRTPPQQDYKVPQGTKIPRRLRTIVVAASALGSNAGRVLTVVPDGTAWLIHSLIVRYTASATIGGRDVNLMERDATGVIIYGFRRPGPTASQIVDMGGWREAIGQPDTTLRRVFTGGGGANVTAFEPLPRFPWLAGFDLFIDDGNDVDTADTIQLTLLVEEFALPRGLARGEIPMGLESGFQWDFSDVRQVV